MTHKPAKTVSSQLKSLFALSTVSLLAACSQPQAPNYEAKVNTTILEDYQALAAESEKLQSAAAECKASPTLDTMQSLKPHWESTMSAWQEIQWVTYGPITESSRQWQLEFWPDQKNIIGRKMKALLAKDTVSEEDLKKAGAIVQGLTALEYLIYDESAATTDPTKSCHLAQMISNSLAQTTQQVANEWVEFGDEQLAQSQNQAEISPEKISENTTQLLSAHLNHLNLIVHKKLENPLAVSLTKETEAASHKKSRPNAYFLESWRSGQSYQNVKDNYASLKTFLLDDGFIQYLKDQGHEKIAVQIEKKLNEIDPLISEEAYFSFTQIQNKEWNKDKSQTLFIKLHDLNKLLAKDVVNALGILISFNASDGDF